MENGNKTGKVGRGNPPENTKFSSTNQPENNGRPKKYTTTIKEATGYTLSQIQDCIKSMLSLDLNKLMEIGQSKEVPALEALIARGIYGDIRKNELKNMEALLSRSFGRPKETLEHKGEIKSTSSGIGSKEWIAQMKADGYSNEEIIKVIESA